MEWRIRRGTAPGVECTVDLEIQFCERCGRDRDAFAVTRAAFRDCPGCGSACCPDCWNLVEGACLVCAPFRLHAETSRSRIVVPAVDALAPDGSDARPQAPMGAPRVDPYADLRTVPDARNGSAITRATARQRPRETPAAGHLPSVAPDAWRAVVAAEQPADSLRPRRRRRRAGRAGLAALAAWIFVGALAVAAFGASPGRPADAPTTPGGAQTAAPAVTAAPAAEPRR